jgi:succinate-semialdehyde dehydrogenase/glutarate-semialdehyde dehydrogenase
MADTDLEKHIPEIARSIVANGGQLCISVERLLVDRRIHAEFTKRLVEHVRGLELTTEYRYGSGMSSKISPRHLARVHEHVEDAVEKGANLLTGGKPRPDVGPMFYEPTVLTDVTPDMALFNAETFGAVVAIYPFDTIDEAVQMANDSGYGLNFSVWTKDPGVGVRVASQLQAGTVGVNDGYAATWSSYDAPLGGMKDSGLSRRHGEVGILKFTEAQTISVQRLVPAFAPFPGMSYQRYQRLLGPMLKVLKRLPFYK